MSEPSPQPSGQGRILLSFTVATFIAALASVWVLADVKRRVGELEQRGGTTRKAASPAPREQGERDGFPAPKPAPEEGAEDPRESRDPLVKLDHLIAKLDEISDDQYDGYNDLTSDIVAIKREIRQLKHTIRSVARAIQQGQPGGLSLTWGLAEHGAELTTQAVEAYTKDAQRHGMVVEPGRVTARAMLNLSPNKQMPIEYFITRFPESGHETLVHMIGGRELADIERDPMGGLRGLGTALYKALVAAGFREGEGSRPDPTAPDPRSARWLLPSGDVVYLYVRYQRGGKTHLARATDWVLDPSTGTVLPDDCFRFTGSLRIEDPESGEDMLAAELGGLLVSVWQNAHAVLEVALDSSVHNDYQYNPARIPKPDGEGPLMLDLIFSKVRLETEGDGAAPLAAPHKLEALPPPPGPKPETPDPKVR
jgi:hypothetical protein